MNNQIDSPILICTAVMMEAKAVAGRLNLKKIAPFCWKSGDIALLNVGIRAPRLAELKLSASTKILIMAGLAGGLDPALNVADVVIHSDPQVARQLGNRIGTIPILENALATATTILATPEDKKELRKKTGCRAVDMETSVAEKFAGARNLQFLAIRAISDTAAQTLDPRVAALVDSDGRPRAAKVAAALLLKPTLMKELSQLKRSANAACVNLADIVAEAVSKWRTILAAK